jgi:hypothetical protein
LDQTVSANNPASGILPVFRSAKTVPCISRMASCETETSDPRISCAHFLKRIFMFVPTQAQQFAVQAKLNMALGKETFDRLFLGMEIDGVSDGVMKIWVRSEHCALDIQPITPGRPPS